MPNPNQKENIEKSIFKIPKKVTEITPRDPK